MSGTLFNKDFDIKLRIMIIGDSQVGKTSIIRRYTKNEFGGLYNSTVGIDFQKKIIDVDSKKVCVQIWDTAGQERFRGVTSTYFQNSHGIILVYDIGFRESFENVLFWINEINSKAKKDILWIIIGNKCDLSKREVTYEEGANIAKNNNIKFYETSAKDNININEIFEDLTKDLVKQYENREKEKAIELENLEKGKKKCC